jgi:pilus assembly protein CpaB
MNRTTRFLIVLLVAVGAASAASYSVYRVVTRMPVRQVEVASVTAVVAARAIPLGTVLAKGDVRTIAWPARNPVPGAFSSVDAVVGRGAIVPLAQNEPVTESKLAPKGAGGGLPPTIPEGMRAISVRTNEVIGVAGFVVPGTRVDVLVTMGADNGRESMSRVVVSNAQVLTAGTRYDQEAAKQEGKPIPTTVVTLLVTPEQAERIALASAEGQVMLTLRNPLDVTPTDTAGVRITSLMASQTAAPPRPPVARAARAEPPAAAPPPPRPYTVEAIRAAKRSEEPVR